MIPVNTPLLGARELELVSECVRDGWISSVGKFITQFEEGWARYCERKAGVAVANGTVALELALKCLDLAPGDEVILPSFTIMSCALAVLRHGAVPVVVDADPETWCMDLDALESRLTPKTRAIMPVHIYGHPVDMDRVTAFAAAHRLAIVEDAAEAHGALYLAARGTDDERWRKAGSFGDVSCFSFYANKPVTTGEGGMLLFDDDRLALRARSLRNLAFGALRRFEHEELGYNYRMTNLQAALGVAQLERIDAIVAKKRQVGHGYRERLEGLPGVQLPVERPWAKSVYWMYGLVLDEATGLDATRCAARLKERGVETRPFFHGIHAQPVLKARGLFRDLRLPVTERLSRQGLYLPSGLTLAERDLDQVVAALREVVR
ncbi:MAG: DegT/DnrJ/EryC1/StrS family aminotransferase [Deltaproteobacteria bacterium]|nr:DegT/DnrJ/EryC1/StrS family aminotransferase [Deltaproteobacteria bacterium]